MFKVQIDLTVQIEGCPEAGLAAVDFRRAAGLPEAPTNWLTLKLVADSEAICRRYQQYLTAGADLVLCQNNDRTPNYTTAEAARPLVAKALQYEYYGSPDIKYYGYPVVPAGVLANFVGWLPTNTPTDGVAVLMDSLILYNTQNGAAVRAAVAEAKATKKAEEAAKAELEAKQKAEMEAKQKAEREAKQKAEAELREWAQANGSELLWLRLVEGFEWVSLALKEWDAAALAGELEATDPEGYHPDGCEDRKQPTLAEIQRLQQVREKFPLATCSLVRVRYEPDTDDEGYTDPDSEAIYRTEVKVEVVCCGHWQREFFLSV